MCSACSLLACVDLQLQTQPGGQEDLTLSEESVCMSSARGGHEVPTLFEESEGSGSPDPF